MSNSKLSEPEVVSSVNRLMEGLHAFAPEVKSLRVDYTTLSYETRLLMRIKSSTRQAGLELELPIGLFTVVELFDADNFDKVTHQWKVKQGNMSMPLNLLTGDRYVIVLKGLISKRAVDEIVTVRAPRDPLVGKEIDKYWLHSAIKDYKILEKIYRELLVDRVTFDVRVGVNRAFSTAIPQEVHSYLIARAALDDIDMVDRQKTFRTIYNYNLVKKSLGKIGPMDIFNLVKDLLSPTKFQGYIEVGDPYKLDHITPTLDQLIPGEVRVGVVTNLNLDRPAADGSLIFKKAEFNTIVHDNFSKLTGNIKKHKKQEIK